MSAVVSAMLALAQLAPGPIDGFRANYASIKVDLSYRHRWGNAPASALAPMRHRVEPAFETDRDPRIEVVGDWGCDGSAEYFRCSSTDAVLRAESRRPPSKYTFYRL